MSTSLTFADAESLADLRTFLQRAADVTDGVARFTSGDGVLRVSVCTFAPFGILDQVPTVLGMRTFAELSGLDTDAVVSGRAMLDRIAHQAPTATQLGIPPMRETAAWAGVETPKGGWQQQTEISTSTLTGFALAGIAEVADALPNQPGDVLVREVRGHVWGREIEGSQGIPQSAAFTAHMLGFLAQDAPVRVFESGRWLRLSTHTGHVLVYRRGGDI